jgi:predicted oxidoreductase
MTAGGALADAMAKIAYDQGVDSAAVAIAWLLRHPAKIVPVLGTNNIQRIKTAADALRVTIDRQTWFELYTLAIGSEVP